MGLVLAELRKLNTVRTNWVVSLIGWVLVGLGAAFFVFEEQFTGPFGGTDAEVAGSIDQIGSNSIIVLVVTVLVMTTEFRHGTIGRTLQLTPSRTRVLSAKLVVGVLYGLAFFVVGLAVVAAVLGVGSVVAGTSLDLGEATVQSLWHGPAGLALTALLGVAVGSLLRSQVVAITVALVWVFVVENLIKAFLPDIGRWLPFQALNSVFVSDQMMANGPGPGAMADPLEPALAIGVFLAYVAVATIVAGILMRVRDV